MKKQNKSLQDNTNNNATESAQSLNSSNETPQAPKPNTSIPNATINMGEGMGGNVIKPLSNNASVQRDNKNGVIKKSNKKNE